MKMARACVAVALVFPAGLAWAEDAEEKRKDWNISLGAGVVSLPEYPGSGSNETRALPLVNVRYKRFFSVGLQVRDLLRVWARTCTKTGRGTSVSWSRAMFRNRVRSQTMRVCAASAISTGLLVLGCSRAIALAGSPCAAARVPMWAEKGRARSRRSMPKPRFARCRSSLCRPVRASRGATGATCRRSSVSTPIRLRARVRAIRRRQWRESRASVFRCAVPADTAGGVLGSRITAAGLLGDAADSPIVEDKNQNTFALFVIYRLQTRWMMDASVAKEKTVLLPATYPVSPAPTVVLFLEGTSVGALRSAVPRYSARAGAFGCSRDRPRHPRSGEAAIDHAACHRRAWRSRRVSSARPP